MVKKVSILVLLAVAFVLTIMTTMTWYNKTLSLLVLGGGFLAVLTTDFAKLEAERNAKKESK